MSAKADANEFLRRMVRRFGLVRRMHGSSASHRDTAVKRLNFRPGSPVFLHLRRRTCVYLVLSSVAMLVPSYAGDTSNEALEKRVRELEKRVSDLENIPVVAMGLKLQKQGAQATSATPRLMRR
jgi:hypothetical protein